MIFAGLPLGFYLPEEIHDRLAQSVLILHGLPFQIADFSHIDDPLVFQTDTEKIGGLHDHRWAGL